MIETKYDVREVKYDVRRGASIYRTVLGSRLKTWITEGKIKKEDVLVWRSGLSGWRKPEELEELKPYFNQWDKGQLTKNDEKDLCSVSSVSRIIRPEITNKTKAKASIVKFIGQVRKKGFANK